MDDRIAEIRPDYEAAARYAVRFFQGEKASQRDILPHIASGVRAIVDAAIGDRVLVDSDALIIRRDENGDWPEWTLEAADPFEVFFAEDGHNGIRVRSPSDILDALASSQGVEP